MKDFMKYWIGITALVPKWSNRKTCSAGKWHWTGSMFSKIEKKQYYLHTRLGSRSKTNHWICITTLVPKWNRYKMYSSVTFEVDWGNILRIGKIIDNTKDKNLTHPWISIMTLIPNHLSMLFLKKNPENVHDRETNLWFH